MDSEKKRLLVTILLYTLDILISTVFFVVLFHTPLFKNIDIFLYRGVIFLVISAIFAVGLIRIFMKLLPIVKLEIKDMLVIFFLFSGFTLAWFILIPVTVERSISVYTLSYLEQNDNKGIAIDEFEKIFFKKYIQDYHAFDKRFHEQEVSGNIEEDRDGEGYVITESGRRIVYLFRLFSNVFDTEKWLVYPNDYEMGG